MKPYKEPMMMFIVILLIQVTSTIASDGITAAINCSEVVNIQDDKLKTSVQQMARENEFNINILKSTVDSLMNQIAELRTSGIETKAELEATKKLLKKSISQTIPTWTMKRIELILPKMNKLQLHQTKPLIVEKLPLPFPINTKALIVSVFCNFGNGKGHAYLGGEIQQKGNTEAGAVKIFNQHFNVYANTWSYEVFVPWNTALSNELQLKVQLSYLTGGNENWYALTVVGYIMA